MDLEINRPLVVLHCDDDAFEIERVQDSLKAKQLDITFDLESFDSPDKFQARLRKQSPTPDVILLDIDLGNAKTFGTDLAMMARKAFSDAVIIMCSNMDDSSSIRKSLKQGADDFISKKSSDAELGLRIVNSYKLSMLKRGAANQNARPVPGLAGATMQTIAKRVPRILGSAITSVHINGESGTGKEVVASIFGSQLEKSAPFIKVNCGAITPSLLESELFGHIKGAFTGATSDKRGLIEAASGGWIFLDEVATLSSSAQTALLRAIENQEIIRVGDNSVRNIKVRFLSATNENLEQLVKEGKFRNDLWQRLCETEIKIPPLRERPDEVEALIKFFCKSMPGGPYEIDIAAMEALSASSWHNGNVRELRNCLRAMTELHVNKLLTPVSIPAKIWDALDMKPDDEDLTAAANGLSGKNAISVSWGESETPNYETLADHLLLELTRLHAKSNKLSIRLLAKLIGMSRSTLSGRLKNLVLKDIISNEELNSLVGITEG